MAVQNGEKKMKGVKIIYPLEDEEQANFAAWLNRQPGLKYTMIPNDVWTTSHKQKARMKRLGLNRGLADMLVLIPKDRSKDGEGYTIYCEMKRAKRSLSTVSDDQQAWHDAINELGVPNIQCYICYGSSEAIKVISHYLKSVENSPF